MSQVLEPPRDINGVPILPGYRPPFKPGFDARRNHAKQSVTFSTNRQAKIIAPSLNSTPIEAAAKLSSLKRAHTRCLAAAVASTSGREAAAWMRAAKDALEQWQSLLGNNPKSHKSTKKPHLAGSQSPADVRPISPTVSPESGNQSANPTSALPASETATDPKID